MSHFACGLLAFSAEHDRTAAPDVARTSATGYAVKHRACGSADGAMAVAYQASAKADGIAIYDTTSFLQRVISTDVEDGPHVSNLALDDSETIWMAAGSQGVWK